MSDTHCDSCTLPLDDATSAIAKLHSIRRGRVLGTLDLCSACLLATLRTLQSRNGEAMRLASRLKKCACGELFEGTDCPACGRRMSS